MLGEKIRKIRILKGYSQEYMATQLAISKTAYSDLEKEKTKLSMERIADIATVFGMEVQDVLTFDEKQVFNNTFTESSKGFFNVKKYITESFEHERTLYKEQIVALKEEVQYLRKKLDEK
jgi:transcriptional regulator with XRE-family HTH domain